MEIALLVVPACPHEAEAAGTLRTALDDIGLNDVGFAVRIIDTQAEAEVSRFVGSPTFSVDGADVFPEPNRVPAVACRLYGGSGVPDLRDLRQALKRAAATSTSR